MSKKSSSLEVAEVLLQINALQLPLQGVDSHAHLDSKDLIADLDQIMLHAKQAGVANIGQVFLSPEEYRDFSPAFAKYPEVFFLLGIHPQDALNFSDECLEDIKIAFEANPRLKAVGEIGLDYFWQDCPADIQKQAFIAQLKLAKSLNKPVVIHSREAEQDCLAILQEENFKDYPLLWHCFGADSNLAEQIISNGWYISIPCVASYPKNFALREAIAAIPLDRIMLETDAPYLAPQICRGKRNEPALTAITIQIIAQILSQDPHKLWEKFGNNARTFFGI